MFPDTIKNCLLLGFSVCLFWSHYKTKFVQCTNLMIGLIMNDKNRKKIGDVTCAVLRHENAIKLTFC